LEGTLDFETPAAHQPPGGHKNARLVVTAVTMSLDTTEGVAPHACTPATSGRLVRRVRDELMEATAHTARTSFAFHVPHDATPSFDIGTVAHAWVLELCFTVEHRRAGGQMPAPQTLRWSLPVTVVPELQPVGRAG
jgi:hypothetical protein